MMNLMKNSIVPALVAGVLLAVGGCTGRPTMFPNPDPALRKKSTEFAADAARRFPYKANAPVVQEEKARAQVGYSLNRLEIVNFTGQDWDDVEVWVNRQYVCHVPRMESRKLKEVHFPMLYNDKGEYFPFDNKQMRVEKVEVYRNGVMHELVFHNADY